MRRLAAPVPALGALAALAAVALVALVALVAAGCGAGAGASAAQTRLTVTDGFGLRTLLEKPDPTVAGGDTVLRLLQRNARVATRYGGGFVQSIDGVAGTRDRVDWFYFVNGVLADTGAGSRTVGTGDRIWWDRHDWTVTERTPAVVGAFPEPFVSGYEGKRVPARIECDQAVSALCRTVQDRFTRLGLPVALALPGTEGGEANLRIVVGRWPDIRQDRALAAIEQGPKASGVYARMDPSGRALAVLDPKGRSVRTLGPGTGFVAATRYRAQAPTWTVTGTDDAGIRRAAAALDESVLGEKFALAISPDDRAVALPQVPQVAGSSGAGASRP